MAQTPPQQETTAPHESLLAGQDVDLPVVSSKNFKVTMLFVDFMICTIVGSILLLKSSAYLGALDITDASGTDHIKRMLIKIIKPTAEFAQDSVEQTSGIGHSLFSIIYGYSLTSPGIVGVLLLTTGMHSLFLYNRVTQGGHPYVNDNLNDAGKEDHPSVQPGHHPTIQEINRHLLLRVVITAWILIMDGVFPRFSINKMFKGNSGGLLESMRNSLNLSVTIPVVHLALLIAAMCTNNSGDYDGVKDENDDEICSNYTKVPDGKGNEISLDKLSNGVYVCNNRNL